MNPSTYNLARMNMVIHGIDYKNIDLQLGNTLEEPKHLDKKFETIISIPPFNMRWSADEKYLKDKRFIDYG